MIAMKKLILIPMLAVTIQLSAADRYSEQMTKHIASIYKARTTEEYQQVINAFERIGNAEKTRWEPFYYASFGYVLMATNEKETSKKDPLLDLAKANLDRASALKPDDSEIAALEGFITMIRLTVDPPSRGPQYSMMAVQQFSHALTLDPKNPRAMALMAQMQLGTAQFFQQEPTEACATARQALELYNAAAPSDPLAPAWGKSMTEGLLANCK
jgi:tetratricopeptide (TPR) repeat protein